MLAEYPDAHELVMLMILAFSLAILTYYMVENSIHDSIDKSIT